MKVKRIISFTAAICLLSTLLCSCANSNDKSDNIIKDIISETSAAEATEEIIAAEESAEEENYLSEYYVEGDYYIEVTDKNGNQKFVYYRPAIDGYEAYTYMHANNVHPESAYGLISVLPNYVTAADKEFDYRDVLTCLDEGADRFAAAFMQSDGDQWGGVFYNDNESYRWIMDYFKSFEPEYIDAVTKHDDGTPMENEELEELGFNFGYSDRLTPTSMYCSANGNYLYSVVSVSLADYNGRYVAKINLDSFNEAAKFLQSGEAPSPEQLEKAYYASFSSESDWFYVEDEFIVELMERMLLSHTADLYQVSSGKNYEEAEENAYLPENITNHFAGGSTDGWNYQGDLMGITYSLPEVPPIASEKMVVWTSDDGYTVKITDDWIPGVIESTLDDETDRYEKYIYEENSSIYGRISYASYYDDVQKAYYDVMGLYSPGGQGYTVECYCKSNERTEEYDEFVKSILGSFDVNTEQKNDMANASKLHAPLVLSETPSRFGDEGYYLADSYALLESDVYKAYSPGIIWADFYAVDYDKSYSTGFEVFLEKKGEDGLWYEVLPIGEISQANDGTGRFYHALEEARRSVQLDLACYPLLTEGDYRIVKPFWEEGNPDVQYGAFYEFKVSEDCYKGEPVVGMVEIEKESYSSDVREISYTVTSDSIFSISSVVDIERCVDGVWKSVRKGAVKTNSIGGSYSIGAHEPLSTADFDLSVSGEYRIRISVGEVTENLDLFTYNYNTLYGCFNIV